MADGFVIPSMFDAPRDLVWRCFTEPERMRQWWGRRARRQTKFTVRLTTHNATDAERKTFDAGTTACAMPVVRHASRGSGEILLLDLQGFQNCQDQLLHQRPGRRFTTSRRAR